MLWGVGVDPSGRLPGWVALKPVSEGPGGYPGGREPPSGWERPAEREKRGMSGVSRQGSGTLARSLVPLSCCSLSLKGRLAELLHY